MVKLDGLEKLTFVDGKKSYEQQFLTRFINKAKKQFREQGFSSIDANIFKSGQTGVYCFGVRGNISINDGNIELDLSEYKGDPSQKNKILEISNELYDKVIDVYSLKRL